MMKNILFAALGLGLAGTAAAHTVQPNTGFYLGADMTFHNGSPGRMSDDHSVTSRNNNSLFLGLKAGYQFTPGFALELGSAGMTQDIQGTTAGGRFEASRKTALLSLSGIYKFTGYVPGVYLKAGLTTGHTEVTYRNSNRTINASGNGTGYLLGFGYEYDFSKHWSAHAGYDRYQRMGGLDDNDSNAINLGFKYRF